MAAREGSSVDLILAGVLANKYEGAEITNETKNMVPIEIHVKHGQDQVAEIELFSCNLAIAPERVDHESQFPVGCRIGNLTDIV